MMQKYIRATAHILRASC